MGKTKFKVWDKDNKKWYMDFLIAPDGKIRPDPYHDILPEHLELVEYTGLKDKNGKEIYGGDIVKTNGNYISDAGKVFDRLGCWFVEMQKELGYFNSGDIEIIGNIYENKELMEI